MTGVPGGRGFLARLHRVTGGAASVCLLLLIGGQAVSALGNEFYHVAFPVVVTGGWGARTFGTVLSAYGVLRLVGLAVGGRLADRFGPPLVMICSDLLRMVGVGVLVTGAAWGGPGRLPLVYVSAVLVGFGEGLFLPPSFAILPSVVSDDALAGANAANYAVVQFMALVGPVLGAVVVAGSGSKVALGIDILTFVASVGTLWIVRGRMSRQAVSDIDTATGPAGRTSLVSVLAAHRALVPLLLIALVGGFGFVAAIEVGLPAQLLSGHRSAVGYGLALSAFAFGAIAGSLGAARLSRLDWGPGRLASVLLVAEALLLTVVTTRTAPLVCAGMFGVGAANALINVLLMTALQRDIPAQALGRVTALLLAGSFGLFPVASATAGWVAQSLGPAAVFWLGAAVLSIAGGVGLSSRQLRGLGRPAAVRDTPTPEAAARTAARQADRDGVEVKS